MKKTGFFYLLASLSLLSNLVFLLSKKISLRPLGYVEYFSFVFIIFVFSYLIAKLYENFGNKTGKDPIFKTGLICIFILDLVNLGILLMRF